MSNTAFPYFLGVIAAYSFLSRIVGFFMPIYFQELGFTGVQIGAYYSVSSLAALLLSLPMGVSSDRKPLTSIFMFSFFLISLSYLGFMISRSFYVFCLFALIGSFGNRFYAIAQNTMFFKLSGAENQRQTGIFILLTMSAAGVGMMSGGLLIAAFHFRLVFLMMMAGYFIFIALAYFLPNTETIVIQLAEYRKTVFTPKALSLIAVFMLSSSHWGAESVSYGPFLKEVLRLNFTQIGLFTGLGLIAVGLGASGGVWLLREGWIKDLRTLFLLGLICAGTCHILMTIPNVYWSFCFRAIHEIGDGFVLVMFYHGIARVFQIDRIGGCAAVITLGQSASSFASGIAFGYISQRFGHQWALIISGIVLLLAAAFLYGNRRENRM